MSIAVNLNTLRGVRDAIRDAIVGKGGTLPVGSPMGSYAEAITNLPSGSGGDTEIPFRSLLTVPEDTDPWHLTSLTATGLAMYAFYGDTLLTSVSLPAVTSINNYAFNTCSSLTSVSFPAATTINSYAFRSCSALTSVFLPAATTIDTYAFNSCTSLTSLSLPAATSINTNVFRNCSSLTDLTLSRTTIVYLSAANAFQDTPIANGTGHIYVPDNLVDQYKTASNWSTYANQILPLSQKP